MEAELERTQGKIVYNQLSPFMANISVTKLNKYAIESACRIPRLFVVRQWPQPPNTPPVTNRSRRRPELLECRIRDGMTNEYFLLGETTAIFLLVLVYWMIPRIAIVLGGVGTQTDEDDGDGGGRRVYGRLGEWFNFLTWSGSEWKYGRLASQLHIFTASSECKDAYSLYAHGQWTLSIDDDAMMSVGEERESQDYRRKRTNRRSWYNKPFVTETTNDQPK